MFLYQIRVQLFLRRQTIGADQMRHAQQPLLRTVDEDHRQQHRRVVHHLNNILGAIPDVRQSTSKSN